MLKFDIFNLVCIIVNLFVLYILMKKFVFGRVYKIIDARAQLIADQNAAAKAKNDEAEALKAQYEKELAAANETSSQIIKEAKDRAKNEYDAILDRAVKDVADMKSSAQKSIAMEREKQMNELHAQIMDLAVETAGKIMSANVDANSDSALYDAFLEEAGDVDGTEDK